MNWSQAPYLSTQICSTKNGLTSVTIEDETDTIGSEAIWQTDAGQCKSDISLHRVDTWYDDDSD